jgi:hypothetical protein
MSIVKSLNENNDPYRTYHDIRKDIPRGTRRSYFFGPGYHHINIIVKGAYSNQNEYLQKLTSWRYNATYRLPWFISIWVWIFYIIAWLLTCILGFLCTILFSVIIFSVIFFGMLIFYVFFSLLWITDRIALAIASV